MFAAIDISPPAAPPAIAVIDERWADARPAIKMPIAPSAKAATVDPRIAEGVAAALAETPARADAPNRQDGLQKPAYGADVLTKFARDFSEAKVPPCLSPATGGLGLFAIPVIAVQAMRGKCLMP
ncbi:MAG: hypothetical protein JWP59_3836 [Massilia sp.]|nr:hypothetical protein [Massilia sp.]